MLMMESGFIAGSANIENLDENAEGFPIVIEATDTPDLEIAMSNSFGFGGTNCYLVFERWPG
jgi:3-oxoacyl-[acyl-carrier-protein] synthase-1